MRAPAIKPGAGGAPAVLDVEEALQLAGFGRHWQPRANTATLLTDA